MNALDARERYLARLHAFDAAEAAQADEPEEVVTGLAHPLVTYFLGLICGITAMLALYFALLKGWL